MDVIKEFFSLMAFVFSIAVLTLLINKPAATAQVENATFAGFNTLLNTVTLQNSTLGGLYN